VSWHTLARFGPALAASHPKPGEWEVLQTWLRRIAGVYGFRYDALLRNALGRTGPGARDLETITEAQLAMLASATGISVKQLRGMNIRR